MRSLGTSECGTRDLCNRKNVIKETGLLIEQQPYPSGLNARVSGELSSLGHRTERLRQKEGKVQMLNLLWLVFFTDAQSLAF